MVTFNKSHLANISLACNSNYVRLFYTVVEIFPALPTTFCNTLIWTDPTGISSRPLMLDKLNPYATMYCDDCVMIGMDVSTQYYHVTDAQTDGLRRT